MILQYVESHEQAELPFDPQETLVVYSDKMKPISSFGGADLVMPFRQFQGEYLNLPHPNIVLMNYSDIQAPSNRTLTIFEYLQDSSVSKKKAIVDIRPFNGEPWRFWWSFCVVGLNPWNWPHSYTVETEWKHWFERTDSSSPFDAENLHTTIDPLREHIVSHLPKVECDFTLRSTTSSEMDKYNAVKELAFEKYSTPKQTINFMIKNLALGVDFNSYLSHGKIELPDFGISRFILEENERRMTAYNILTDNV